VRTGISPKDFAEAIGVSESSVKRWVDQGALTALRTTGGHRRISRHEALRFIREQHGQLVRPEKLGLEPSVLGIPRNAPLQQAAEQLHGYLLHGREPETRGVLTGVYLAGNTIAAIGDDVIRPAMERLGVLWHDSEHGILVEHRATTLCLRVLEELRGMIHDTAAHLDGAKVAVVAGPERDPYLLAPTLTSLTLFECGLEVVSLGPDTPLSVVELAAREAGASLIALSCTSEPDDRLRREVARLVDNAVAAKCHVALGGKTVASLGVAVRPYVLIGRSLRELVEFASHL